MSSRRAGRPDGDRSAGPAIEVRGLVKRYHGRPAVDGLDLTVEAGETVALLGPNGAGKTTTVEVLEGFLRPDAGTARVLGVDPRRATAAWKARIGIVAQRTDDYPDLTVGEAVADIAGYYPAPRPVADVVAAVGLQDKRAARCSTLSGGQRRRLDVALGIVGRPELLFLDEPTTGFDPEARRAFWQLIAGLHADGTTILLTTHYLDEAEQLADRVAVIAAGRVLAVGPPASLGGRDEGEATVRWRGPDGPRARTTARPTALIEQLAREFGGEVPHLAVERPSLEDVYVHMIERANVAATERSRETERGTGSRDPVAAQRSAP